MSLFSPMQIVGFLMQRLNGEQIKLKCFNSVIQHQVPYSVENKLEFKTVKLHIKLYGGLLKQTLYIKETKEFCVIHVIENHHS